MALAAKLEIAQSGVEFHRLEEGLAALPADLVVRLADGDGHRKLGQAGLLVSRSMGVRQAWMGKRGGEGGSGTPSLGERRGAGPPSSPPPLFAM